MEDIKKAIKHFECVKNDAVAVLDSGFGSKPNESNTLYKNRKLYAELAISALRKRISIKPIPHKVDTDKIRVGNGCWGKGTTIYKCPRCSTFTSRINKCCGECGQALDWSDSE